MSRSPSRWSLVRISRPELSRSSRPTGNTQRGRSAERVVDGGPAAGVDARRDEAHRLVERDHDALACRRRRAAPSTRDAVAARVDPAPGPALDGAADPHAAVGDPALRLARASTTPNFESARASDSAARSAAGLRPGAGRLAEGERHLRLRTTSLPVDARRGPAGSPSCCASAAPSPSSSTWSPATHRAPVAHPVDAHEVDRGGARFSGLDRISTAPAWAIASVRIEAGSVGTPPGPGDEVALVRGDVLEPDDAPVRLQLEDAVHQQERASGGAGSP